MLFNQCFLRKSATPAPPLPVCVCANDFLIMAIQLWGLRFGLQFLRDKASRGSEAQAQIKIPVAEPPLETPDRATIVPPGSLFL